MANLACSTGLLKLAGSSGYLPNRSGRYRRHNRHPLLLAHSALFPEKRGEDGSAVISQNATDDGGAVIEPRIVGDVEQRFAGAGFRVGASINDPRHSRQDDGAGAHGAWLKGDIKQAAVEPPRTKRGGSLRYGKHFGVGRGILEAFALVAGPADDAPVKETTTAPTGTSSSAMAARASSSAIDMCSE